MNTGVWVLTLESMGMRKLNLERNIWFYYHICWEEYVNMSYVIHIFSHLSFFQSSSLKKIHFSVLLWYFYHFIIYFCNFSSLNFTYIFKYIYTHLYIFPPPFPYAFSFFFLLSFPLYWYRLWREQTVNMQAYGSAMEFRPSGFYPTF